MDKYRNIGVKLTPQRIAILDYLAGNKKHPSADEVYQAVIRRFPTMSLATVYSTLAALKEKGNIIELTIDPNKKRYDPEPGSHHHLICVSCRRIVDVPIVYALDLPESAKEGFSIINTHVEFYGLCPSCSKQSQPTNEEVSPCV